MATFTFRCPTCATSTTVTTKDSGVILGSGPPLTARFDCASYGLTLNATTTPVPDVWPDRAPPQD